MEGKSSPHKQNDHMNFFREIKNLTKEFVNRCPDH